MFPSEYAGWMSSDSPHFPAQSARRSPQTSFAHRFDWWRALVRVLASVESIRDGRAMYLLLASFSGGGLALACARASLGRAELAWAIGQGAAALFITFYGSNATGLLMMDRAMGRPRREIRDAVFDALGVGHRVLLIWSVVCVVVAALAALVWALFWLSSLPVVGPWVYAVVVPFTVVLMGWAIVAVMAVLAPLAGPTVWSGTSTKDSVCLLGRFLREQLLQAAVLAGALSVLTALVGAVTSALVFAGGRVMAELSIWLLGVDVEPQLFMAGLFGHGLQVVSLPGVPASAVPYLTAATIGGGVVFAIGLVLPTLVYLRGVCEIHVTLRGRLAELDRR